MDNRLGVRENNTISLKDGRILAYAEYGDPKGKPLFFFHGWPSSRFQGSVTHKATAMDLKIYTDDWGFPLNKIKSEILLWYGEKDKNVSINMGKHYAFQIKKSKLTIYPNEGHFLIRRHVEKILRTLVS